MNKLLLLSKHVNKTTGLMPRELASPSSAKRESMIAPKIS